MNFYEAMLEFFTHAERENNRRWDEFFKLAEYLTTNLPATVRRKLGDKKLRPSSEEGYGTFDFTTVDILWWKEKRKAKPTIMKDDKVFASEVKLALLDVMDQYNLEMDDALESACREIIKKIDNGDKDGK